MEKKKVSDQAQSLSSKDEPNSPVKNDYSAQDVADAFVKQYYNILQDSPQDAHRFYNDKSILAHPCPDGSMKSATTLKDIDTEIMASNMKEWNPNLETVHAQDSVMGSVIVGVTGYLTDNDNMTKHFAHTFCLAPQEGGGFYVQNDFLQFVELKASSSSPSVDDEASATASPPIVKAKGSAEKDKNKVATSSSKGKSPLPTEPKQKSQSLSIREDANRVSYASIVAKEGPVASTTPQASPIADRKKAITITPKQSVAPVKPLILPSLDVLEKTYDVRSIRIKDLPSKVTEESLLEAVKRFGAVRNKNIQIKEYSEDGYRYAFVEFDNPKSARTAVEARFLRFEDRECEIQYKKYNQGGYNYMGRGGFRNDNFWGNTNRGSWGGNRFNDNESNFRRNNNRFFQGRPGSFS